MADKRTNMVVHDNAEQRMRVHYPDDDYTTLDNMGLWDYSLNLWGINRVLGDLTKTYTAAYEYEDQTAQQSILTTARQFSSTYEPNYVNQRFDEAKRSLNRLRVKNAATVMTFQYDEDERLITVHGKQAEIGHNEIVAADCFRYIWKYPNTPTTKPTPDDVMYVGTKYYRQASVTGLVPVYSERVVDQLEPATGWVPGSSNRAVLSVVVVRKPEAGENVPTNKVIQTELWAVQPTKPINIYAD